jgi:DNA/RNA endonuclease YhcR with UshA esterase domain
LEMPCSGRMEVRIEQAKSSLPLEKYSTGRKGFKSRWRWVRR